MWFLFVCCIEPSVFCGWTVFIYLHRFKLHYQWSFVGTVWYENHPRPFILVSVVGSTLRFEPSTFYIEVDRSSFLTLSTTQWFIQAREQWIAKKTWDSCFTVLLIVSDRIRSVVQTQDFGLAMTNGFINTAYPPERYSLIRSRVLRCILWDKTRLFSSERLFDFLAFLSLLEVVWHFM